MTIKASARFVALITAIAMIFTLFTAVTGIGGLEASAASETTVNKSATIKNGPLTVRSGPGTNYEALGTVAKGKTIKVLTKTTNSKGEVWYKYQYSSSKKGYVLAKYVTVKSSNEYTIKTFKRKAKVKSSLTVRSGPGSSYSKLGTLKKGQYIYIKKKVILSSGKVWYRFKYNGKVGYVSSSYVKLTKIASETTLNRKATIKNGPLNVRSGTSTSKKKLGTIAKGKQITVLKKITKTNGEVWYQFQYTSSKKGYLLAKYVKLSNIVSETSLTRKAIVKENNLTVRSGPGTGYSKLGSLSKGKTVYVNQKVVLASGKVWYRIKYGSKNGYVSGSYLTVTDIVSETSLNRSAVVLEGPLNVRSGAGTGYSSLGKLEEGTAINVIQKIETTSGTWYKYKYKYSSSQYGYVAGSYLKVGLGNGSNLTSSEFEAWMNEQGFPDSYKSYLRTLHEAHPAWIFRSYDVGTTFAKAVAKEMNNPYANTVYKSWPESYRLEDYKDSPKEGGWYAASKKVIRHYMDPRNFLNETYIFEFMIQTYDSATQNASTVAAVVDGTFMETRSTGDSTYPTYAKLINAVGKATGVNPNVLAAMIRQEQGVNGTSSMISGTYSGYEGYYNFFNVKASGSTEKAVIVNGLKYAKEQGWNTVYKSIKGGAEFYGANYVLKNQDTFYTKKFNVKNGYDSIGTHQYMTNVAGGASEGKLLKQALPSNNEYEIVFEIPVYDSMPSSICKLPS